MRLLYLLPVALWAATVSAQSLKSWAGTNSYFLQSLDDGQQVKHIQDLAALGVKVIRLWVREQLSHCEKGSVRGQTCRALENQEFGGVGRYDPVTMDLLDKTLLNIQTHGKGMKVIISPHDSNSVQGIAIPQDSYTLKYPQNDFYHNGNAEADYDNRLKYIMEYQGQYMKRPWKDLHDLIIAFDVQNEPLLAYKGTGKPGVCSIPDSAKGWVCKRATNMRKILGADNPIKIASGGIGGDANNQCSFLDDAMKCPDLDVIALHIYPDRNGGGIEKHFADWSKQGGGGKLIYVEELGLTWRKLTGPGCANNDPNVKDWDVPAAFKASAEKLNNAGIPWLSWSIIPDVVPECQQGFNDDCDSTPIPITQKKVDFAGPMKAAADANLTPGDFAI